jgi:hypothetical protein
MAQDASIPTRRHSSATPRLEHGVSRRVLQAWLGHQSPRTTARSTHLTAPILDVVHATSTALMADRCACWRAVMPELADVLRRDGREDLDRCGQDLRPRHRRAMDEMMHGRPEA